MEEITLRFEIVRLAVELGDFETIDLQCRKLRNLSLDDRLNEIIDLLESRNYRQALYGMKFYHQTLRDDFFDEEAERDTEKEEKDRQNHEALVSDDEEDDNEERVLDLDEILRLSAERVTRVPEPEPEEAVEPEDTAETVPRNVFPVEESSKTSVSESGKESLHNALSSVDETTGRESGRVEEKSPLSASTVRKESIEGFAQKSASRREETLPEESDSAFEEKEEESTVAGRKSELTQRVRTNEEKKPYPPISYIGQKFRNMMHQFPPLERSEVLAPEVEKMRKKIAEEGYTDTEIEAFLTRYQEYKKRGERAMAAQVLLLAAATESKFAQFLLARELFRGEVIQKDHAESFTQINTLADQNFAEAICDLGQFYEYGIGIGKDREMALLLYEEAAELGVARARKHYERLKNSRGIKGLLGKVKVPLKLPKKTKE